MFTYMCKEWLLSTTQWLQYRQDGTVEM